MESPQDKSQLEHQMVRLENAARAEEASRNAALRAARIVSVGLAATIVIFVCINFFSIRGQWTEENLRSSLAKEVRELSPTAAREIGNVGRAILPVYAEEVSEQVTALLPTITKRLEQEIDALTMDVLTTTERQFSAAQERVLAQCEKEILENHPILLDPKRRAELQERFHAITEEAVITTAAEFHTLFSRDIERVQERLLDFDLADTDETTVDLQKRFLRLWLQLLDEEIAQL
jgi:hypothetical protein